MGSEVISMNILRKTAQFTFGKACLYHLYQFIKGVDPEVVVFFSKDGIYGEDFLRLHLAFNQAPEYEGLHVYFVTSASQDAAILPPASLTVDKDSVDFIKKCAAAKYIISDSPLPRFVFRTKTQRFLYIPNCKTLDTLLSNAPGKAFERQLIRRPLRNRFSHILWPAVDHINLQIRHNIQFIRTDYPRIEVLQHYTIRDVVRSRLATHIPIQNFAVAFCMHTQEPPYNGLLSGIRPGISFIFYNETTSVAQIYDGDAHQNVLCTRPLPRSTILLACDVLVTDSPSLAKEYAYTGKDQVVFYAANQLPQPFWGHPVSQDAQGVITAIENMGAQAMYREKAMPDFASPSVSALEHFIMPHIRLTKKKKWNMRVRRKMLFIKTKVKGLLRRSNLARTENDRLLAAYHNAHQGERCFLVGNGPSLSIADLNMIQGEISFSCNLIYKIFDLTSWRPNYHFLVDGLFAQNYDKEISEHINVPFFTMEITKGLMRTYPIDTIYAYPVFKTHYRVRGNMLDYYVPSNATVMSFMIEMAMYMGFAEIYLLGVDCSNTLAKGSHFIQDYRPESLRKQEENIGRKKVVGNAFTALEYGEYNRNRSVDAYKKLSAYAQKNGVRIINCTRGGLLEVYTRAKLEDVLNKRT